MDTSKSEIEIDGKKRRVRRKGKPRLYAVHEGRTKGVYSDWNECSAQVKGYNGAKYRSFALKDREAAEHFVKTGCLLLPPVEKEEEKPAEGEAKEKEERTAKSDNPMDSKLTFLSSSGWNEDLQPVIIYSDGSAKVDSPQTGVKMVRGGYGIWFGKDDPRNLIEEYRPIRVERVRSEKAEDMQATSNKCELMAILRAIDRAEEWTRADKEEENELPPPADCGFGSEEARRRCLWIRPDQLLVVACDSKYSMRCVAEYFPGWAAHGWRTKNGTPVKNRTLIEAARKRFLSRPVMLCYVPAHCGVPGNEAADRLARKGSGVDS